MAVLSTVVLGAGFEAFGWLHGAAVAGFIGFVWVLVVLGRRARAQGTGEWFDLIVGTITLCVWVTLLMWWLSPERRDIRISLPLHLCDVANLAAGLAMVFPRRGLRVMVHYWAFGLTTQAFVTPTLADGPDFAYFWIFWAYHYVIVGLAVYDVVVRGFRPGWRDLLFAVVVSTVYVMIALPVNMITGGNYGYVGQVTPKAATIIDALGPWPWRVGVMGGLGIASFVLIQLVWMVSGLAGSNRPAPARPETQE